MSLTAVIITKNEAGNIQRCLSSLSFAAEQIVVDAGSTDNTAQLAAQLGARVFVKPWTGYGPQKNFGLKQANNEWLLFIDADEEITPELAKEIIATINHPARDLYWLRIITIFLGRPLSHLSGHNLRLFKKDRGLWTDDAVHEQVKNKHGQIIKLGDQRSFILTAPLLHHSHPTIASHLKKIHRYTTLDAKQMQRTSRHRSGQSVKPSFFLPYRLALKQFVKLYFYRRGCLDGRAGFIWCLLSSYYEFEMAKKYLNL